MDRGLDVEFFVASHKTLVSEKAQIQAQFSVSIASLIKFTSKHVVFLVGVFKNLLNIRHS